MAHTTYLVRDRRISLQYGEGSENETWNIIGIGRLNIEEKQIHDYYPVLNPTHFPNPNSPNSPNNPDNRNYKYSEFSDPIHEGSENEGRNDTDVTGGNASVDRREREGGRARATNHIVYNPNNPNSPNNYHHNRHNNPNYINSRSNDYNSANSYNPNNPSDPYNPYNYNQSFSDPASTLPPSPAVVKDIYSDSPHINHNPNILDNPNSPILKKRGKKKLKLNKFQNENKNKNLKFKFKTWLHLDSGNYTLKMTLPAQNLTEIKHFIHNGSENLENAGKKGNNNHNILEQEIKINSKMMDLCSLFKGSSPTPQALDVIRRSMSRHNCDSLGYILPFLPTAQGRIHHCFIF